MSKTKTKEFSRKKLSKFLLEDRGEMPYREYASRLDVGTATLQRLESLECDPSVRVLVNILQFSINPVKLEDLLE